MSLTEKFGFDESASIAFDQSNTKRAKPKPLQNRKRARVQGENPYILALFVFIDELTLTHRELASP